MTATPERVGLGRGAALAIDAVCVLVFATLGRASHSEGITIGGIAGTAWPFLLGLLVGWGILLWRKGIARVTEIGPGVTIWVCTWWFGLLFRRVFTSGGVEFSFFLVAGAFLGLFLVGWRFVAGRLGRS